MRALHRVDRPLSSFLLSAVLTASACTIEAGGVVDTGGGDSERGADAGAAITGPVLRLEVDRTADEVAGVEAAVPVTGCMSGGASGQNVAYSETVARQTFKELTPILQSDYVGGPVFTGNPSLQMSNLKNYDLRVD